MSHFSEFWSDLHSLNAPKKPSLAFSDATDPRIQTAFQKILKTSLIEPFLVGPPDLIHQASHEHKLNEIPKDRILWPSADEEKTKLALLLQNQQKKLKRTKEQAQDQLKDSLYTGLALLLDNKIDGLLAGSLRPTADVVRAVLQCIGPAKGSRLISGHFLMESKTLKSAYNTPFLFADCAVMPEPSPRSLAAIAEGAAAAYGFFTGKKPKVALLSFGTRGSAEHPLVDRIREVKEILQKKNPDLLVDGEIQLDAALDAHVAKIKNATDSPVAPEANVFIFPNLESGNIGYKLVQRFSEARIAGPLMWGLGKPVSDLSRGCTVDEIVDTAFCVAKMAIGKN